MPEVMSDKWQLNSSDNRSYLLEFVGQVPNLLLVLVLLYRVLRNSDTSGQNDGSTGYKWTGSRFKHLVRVYFERKPGFQLYHSNDRIQSIQVNYRVAVMASGITWRLQMNPLFTCRHFPWGAYCLLRNAFLNSSCCLTNPEQVPLILRSDPYGLLWLSALQVIVNFTSRFFTLYDKQVTIPPTWDQLG